MRPARAQEGTTDGLCVAECLQGSLVRASHSPAGMPSWLWSSRCATRRTLTLPRSFMWRHMAQVTRSAMASLLSNLEVRSDRLRLQCSSTNCVSGGTWHRLKKTAVTLSSPAAGRRPDEIKSIQPCTGCACEGRRYACHADCAAAKLQNIEVKPFRAFSIQLELYQCSPNGGLGRHYSQLC